MNDRLHIFGIRHHGPGSARSLGAALATLQPDCVLVEGPPDAQELLSWAGHAEMQPPVSLLTYSTEQQHLATYHPFAEYSPEWVAIRHALTRGVPVRFIDLPQSVEFARSEERRRAWEAQMTSEPGETDEEPPAAVDPSPPEAGASETDEPAVWRDPLSYLAEASGFSDGERWWEHVIETRRDHSGVFAAILEAMTTLRESVKRGELPGFRTDLERDQEMLREAWMRQGIRAALKEGFERIAVVCGAWHAPALAELPTAKADSDLLRGLPRMKVEVAWTPWTYGRLSVESGYGAGVHSPGWYHHLWHWPEDVTVRWMTGVARLLREEGLDASSASVIEAVRLAESLAGLRGRPLPGLPELNDSCLSVFCFGGDAPMRLIRDRLIIGERMGTVPADVPAVPIQRDLARLQKRLRLPPEPAFRDYDLDLRRPSDLERSCLLHRLNLLGIPWGTPISTRGTGTFHEGWRLQWLPELSLHLILAGVWGSTVLEAATRCARDLAEETTDLPQLTALTDQVLLADLPEAVGALLTALESRAAVTADAHALMESLPRLVAMIRYPNVRGTDRGILEHVTAGLVTRLCVGLPGACSSLDDTAAGAMYDQIASTHSALELLGNAEHREAWLAALRAVADLNSPHGLVAGRCTWLLLDTGVLDQEEAARRLSLALSRGEDPARSAAWIQGFLTGNADLLIHTPDLLTVLDRWVSEQPDEAFQELLPLLRRTFSGFTAPERRNIGERLRAGAAADPASGPRAPAAFDPVRARAALATVRTLLGLTPEPRSS